MNIDELPAGPKLDTLVAEKVMGWYSNGLVWCDKGGSVGYWIGDNLLGHVLLPSDEERLRKEGRWPIFRPSTDIKAVWEVVKEITEQQQLSLRLVGPCFADGFLYKDGWYAAFVEADYAFTDIGEGAVAETPALAICRAALKAVGAMT